MSSELEINVKDPEIIKILKESDYRRMLYDQSRERQIKELKEQLEKYRTRAEDE